METPSYKLNSHHFSGKNCGLSTRLIILKC